MYTIMSNKKIKEIEDAVQLLRDEVNRCNARSQIKHLLNPVKSIDFASESYHMMLKTADRIQCISRIIEDNLPSAFTSNEIESMLYNRGSICSFLYNDVLTFAPFASGGKLNNMGQLSEVQPVMLNGDPLGSRRKCYGVDANYNYDSNCCVIIQDYTGCIQGDKVYPRAAMNSSTTIHDEVIAYRQLLYNVVMNIKKLIVRCENEEQLRPILEQASMLLDPTQPIIGLKDINLTNNFDMTSFVDKVDVDGLTKTIDFYNKIRRQFNGIPSPDVFEKKERMLTDELEDVGKTNNLILWDAYINRKIAFDNINKCFGTNIVVRINDMITSEGDNDGQYGKNMEIQGSSNNSN